MNHFPTKNILVSIDHDGFIPGIVEETYIKGNWDFLPEFTGRIAVLFMGIAKIKANCWND